MVMWGGGNQLGGPIHTPEARLQHVAQEVVHQWVAIFGAPPPTVWDLYRRLHAAGWPAVAEIRGEDFLWFSLFIPTELFEGRRVLWVGPTRLEARTTSGVEDLTTPSRIVVPTLVPPKDPKTLPNPPDTA